MSLSFLSFVEKIRIVEESCVLKNVFAAKSKRKVDANFSNTYKVAFFKRRHYTRSMSRSFADLF